MAEKKLNELNQTVENEQQMVENSNLEEKVKETNEHN